MEQPANSSRSANPSGLVPGRAAHVALAVLFAINALNFYDRQVIGAVGEEIRREWSLSDTQLGQLSTAFTLLYAVVGVPFGRWADRGRRTRILIAGVVAWSALTALCGFCRNFKQLYLVRLGVGVGEATCAPAAASLIGDLYPSANRGRAMSIFMLGLPVGIAVGFFVSGLVAQRYGWRATFWVAGAPGVLCALAVAFVREPARVAPGQRPVDRPAGESAVWRVLAIGTLWPIIASGVLFNFSLYAIGSFLVAYLRRFHGLDPWHANLASTVGLGLSGIPGLLLGGWLADWAARRREQGRLRLGAVFMLAAALPWFLALAQPAGSVQAFTIYVSLGCGLMYFYYGSVYATIQDVVEPQLRGTAMAIYFCAMYILGASFGPWLVGLLSDRLTVQAAVAAGATDFSPAALEPFRAAGLRSAMWIIPALMPVLAVVLWSGSLTVQRDVRRAREES